MNDNINLDVEPNYQILFSIVNDLFLIIEKEHYLSIKDNRDTLISELALIEYEEHYDSTEVDEQIIQFIVGLIIKYVDLDDPVFIDDMCVFTEHMDKLMELYDKALFQVNEGKFPNMIFKECL